MTTTISTTNQTSFGVAFADATALVLDGLPNIGEKRAERFERAKERATTALSYTDNPVEQLLVTQFLQVLKLAEQRRWDV